MISIRYSALLLAACAWIASAHGEEPATPLAPQLADKVAPALKILLPGDAPEGVRWAAQALRDVAASLADGKASADFTVKVYLRPEDGAGGELVGAVTLPDAPESFAIAPDTSDANVTLVAGRGATGTMYGLLELAEQVKAGLRQPVARSPRVKLRADNLFLHLDKDGRVAPWFHEDEFWTRYLDLLARSRFNTLDIHGAYCVETTAFSTITRLFVPNGESGKGSKDADTCAKNMARLKWIVERAAARGVRVALMNYGGAGLGRDGEDNGKDENARALSRQARRILEEVPALWMLGSRCKESGEEAAERFAEAYAEPLRKARDGKDWRWTYTRSWGTDRKTIDELAKRCGGRLRVEVKYNGEHLGLPYPAIQGWGEDYSYQDFLNKPRKYEVVWQVRAAGTHRLFRWADPAFIRRAVQSFSLGSAEGFSLESPVAYRHLKLDGDPARSGIHSAPVPMYAFERHKPWYVMWGRLSYAPEDSDEALRLACGQTEAEFKALVAASRIVPKVYAAYCIGIDHRDAAPELEIGLTERGRKGEVRTLEELTQIAPLDRARGCSPDEFAQAVTTGQFEPRTTPLNFAMDIQMKVSVLSAARSANPNFSKSAIDGTALDQERELDALCSLGESTAARLRALTYYALYRHTQDEAWLPEALKEIRTAKEKWSAYSSKLKEVFGKVEDPLRMGAAYDPEKVLKHFDQIEKGIAETQKKARKQGREAKRQPILWNRLGSGLGPFFAQPECVLARSAKRLDVRLDFDLVKVPAEGKTQPVLPVRVVALVKPLTSEAQWKELKMNREGEGQAARFMLSLDEPANGLLVQFTLYDEDGRGTFWPDAEQGMPYLWTSDFPAAKP